MNNVEENQTEVLDEVEALDVSNPFDLIKEFENEFNKINELEQKGKHKEATAKSGRFIRRIKQEIKKIKSNEQVSGTDLELLEQVENYLDEQLEWHKNQLTNRYKNEFRKKDATVKAILTVLPKGIVLQTKRVVNCINQIKEAKTNKERLFKVVELAKQLGLLVATPVIFTVKFIIKHWYLLLLLLMLLKLPDFDFGKKKKPPEEDHTPEPAYEPAYEPVDEPVNVPVGDEVKDPVLDPLPEEPALEPQIIDQPEPAVNPGVVPQAVEPVTQSPITVDEFYDMIAKSIKDSCPDVTDVFNSYEDAFNYLVSLGLTYTEAEIALAGGYDGAFSNIKWITGQGGVFESTDSALRALAGGQAAIDSGLEEYIAAHNAELQQILARQSASVDYWSFLGSLTGTELTLFLIYEFVQYGLAIPTGGLSLLAPG